MKKIIFLLAIVFTITTAFVTVGEPEKDILGKWRVDENYINNFVIAQIETRRKVNPEQAEQMEQNMDMMSQTVGALIFDYKNDNTIELTSPQGTQIVKWRLSPDNHSLFILRTNGTERKDSILQLTPTSLKVLQGERKDTIAYVRP